jgi:hypothetical protein
MQTIDSFTLHDVRGGAGQAELRALAQQYCPKTYARNRLAPMITRPMGERCLDEAGLGAFKSRLDEYFK